MVFRWAGGCCVELNCLSVVYLIGPMCVYHAGLKMQWNKNRLSRWEETIFHENPNNEKSIMLLSSLRYKQELTHKHKIFFRRLKKYFYFHQPGMILRSTIKGYCANNVFYFYFRMERDADFLHKKAERATLRVCLREKYRLPKVKSSSVTCIFTFYLILYINKLFTVGTHMHDGWLLVNYFQHFTLSPSI